jgi:hypothetical protein
MLVKEMQALLIHHVEMVNCFENISLNSFPTSREEKPNKSIRPRGFLLGCLHDNISDLLLSKRELKMM